MFGLRRVVMTCDCSDLWWPHQTNTVIPAEPGAQGILADLTNVYWRVFWIPAFAGMTFDW